MNEVNIDSDKTKINLNIFMEQIRPKFIILGSLLISYNIPRLSEIVAFQLQNVHTKILLNFPPPHVLSFIPFRLYFVEKKNDFFYHHKTVNFIH